MTIKQEPRRRAALGSDPTWNGERLESAYENESGDSAPPRSAPRRLGGDGQRAGGAANDQARSSEQK